MFFQAQRISVVELGYFAMVAVGVLLFLIGPDHSPSGSGLIKASTSIQFGADFYTTSAQYTGLAANALVDLFDLVRYAVSAFFALGGLLTICLAGKALSGGQSRAPKAAMSAPATVKSAPAPVQSTSASTTSSYPSAVSFAAPVEKPPVQVQGNESDV